MSAPLFNRLNCNKFNLLLKPKSELIKMNYDPKPAIRPGEPLDKTTVKFESTDLHNSIVARDTEGVIKLVCNYTTNQRMQLVEAYRKNFERDPIEDLRKDFHGDFEDLITGLLHWPMEYASVQIHKAIGRTGLNVRVIIDTLTCCSNEEINELRHFYKQKFNRDLVEHIHAESTGGLRLIFTQILSNCRREVQTMNVELARQHAVELMAIVEMSPERLEEFFINLITTEPQTQLRAIFYEYDKMNAELDLDKVIEAKFNGDVKLAVKSMVEMIRYLPRYFAVRLNKAIDSWVTDVATIIRIIISRREIDLDNIKAEYKANFNHELVRDVKNATSGDCRRCLLALIGKK